MGDPFSGGDVPFDFEGSLQLARQLWALADEIESENSQRQLDFVAATAKWRGVYGRQFIDRRHTEQKSVDAVCNGLREDAKAWAKAWAEAMEQQGRNNRAKALEDLTEKIAAERSLREKAVDYFVGDDSAEEADRKLASVHNITPPAPPLFSATATPQRF